MLSSALALDLVRQHAERMTDGRQQADDGYQRARSGGFRTRSGAVLRALSRLIAVRRNRGSDKDHDNGHDDP
jgi:hypothetical protein